MLTLIKGLGNLLHRKDFILLMTLGPGLPNYSEAALTKLLFENEVSLLHRCPRLGHVWEGLG